MDSKRSTAASPWLRLDIEVPSGNQDDLSDVLWQLNTTGIQEFDERGLWKVQAFFTPAESTPAFVKRVQEMLHSRGIEPVSVEASECEFETDQWLKAYRSSFQAFSIGGTFFIHPPWRNASAAHPVNIVIEPELAFGTGTHESTQLALLSLRAILPDVESMLDVGTGSGILSIAAKKLKPDLAVAALDIDEASVRVAARNVQANRVLGVLLFTGTTNALRSTFDLVIANLTLALFRDLAEELVRLGGEHLVLSGFTGEQVESVLHLFQSCSTFQIVRDRRRNDWACLHLKHEICLD